MPPKSRLTVAQLKAELDTLGVPYDAKAKKAVLVELLEKVSRVRVCEGVRGVGRGWGAHARSPRPHPRPKRWRACARPLNFRPD